MGSTTTRSVAVVQESTFAQISSSTGVPADISGESWVGLECERASVAPFGDPALQERDNTRDGTHILPPQPDSMWDSANSRWHQRRTGKVTLSCPLRPMGNSALTDWDAAPLGMLLSSGMYRVDPSLESDEVQADSSVNDWQPNVLANFTVGGIVQWTKNGRQEYSAVTDLDSGGLTTVTVSPALSATPASPDVVYLMPTWVESLNMSNIGSSVSLRLSGDGWRTYATGCRMESWALSFEGDRMLCMLNITMDCAIIWDDHSSSPAAANPTILDGRRCSARGSYVVMSTGAVSSGSVPASLLRTAYSAQTWEATYTNTLAPAGRTDDLAGMSDMHVTDHSIEVTATLSTPVTALDTRVWAQAQHSLMLGMAGGGGNGEGAALYIPAATLLNDPAMRNVGGQIVMQDLQFGAGEWALDDGSTGAANTHIRLAVGGMT